MIKFDHVTFQYDAAETPAIKDITLHIKQGELVLFCGKSGSGKSTITKLINGLIPRGHEGELTGEVTVNDTPISKLPMYALSEMVGSVFQNPKTQFYNVDTTSELAFNLENRGIDLAVITASIDKVMQQFDITHLLDRNIFELSGGEKQIIACATVLLANPDIIVLDEPSSNLDMYSIKKLKEMIQYLKDEGKTIVLVDHRLDYIMNDADRIVYIEDGKIASVYDLAQFKSLSTAQYEEMGLRFVPTKAKLVQPAEETKHIEIKDFTYAYDRFSKRKQLDIATAQIPTNEVVAIIGNNGSGKSTFAKSLSGLNKRFKGRVTYDNHTFKSRQLLKQSYMVFQDVNNQLFTENLEQELKLLDQQVDDAQVDEMLAQIHLLDKKAAHPFSLSGGEKQRLAIATAIMSHKRIIIFDEPTSGLDLFHMKKVAALIHSIKNHNKMVLIITHDKALISEICSYVLHFAEGKIIDQYPLDEQGQQKLDAYFDV